MRLVFDIETDGLDSPSTVHCVCVKDVDTEESYDFSGFSDDPSVFGKVLELFEKADLLIGHNIISYDTKVLAAFYEPFKKFFEVNRNKVVDTLVLSRLLWQDRPGGHSLDAWGDRLHYAKHEIEDFSKFTPELLERCRTDTELNRRVYLRLMHKLGKDRWARAMRLELDYQWIARDMHENGFRFDKAAALAMLEELVEKLAALDAKILKAFPPRVEVIELKTKTKIVETPFNPASPKQLVDVLWEGGWDPVDKTNGHIKALRERKGSIDKSKMEKYQRYGWKVNETNLKTLPADAAPEYHLLVERMMTEARKRTLIEWLENYNDKTGRIHGDFNPLGTRTQRCVHTRPNMGNVPTKKTIKYNAKHLRDLALEYGGRMRSMWICDDDAWLVGCDMEGAHLRIFAHLINDEAFIKALISGRKEDGTDAHSMNKRAFGDICVDRDRAKTGIFTFLNGGGAEKFKQIFDSSYEAAKDALDNLVKTYPGLSRLKKVLIPADAKRGYFEGIDGRFVINDSAHHMMGMYLQNMESVLMKYANVLWKKRLDDLGIRYKQVNWVHDEWVTEVYGDKSVAEKVGKIQADAIREVGEMFKLNCPMGGEYKIGKNWLDVH